MTSWSNLGDFLPGKTVKIIKAQSRLDEGGIQAALLRYCNILVTKHAIKRAKKTKNPRPELNKKSPKRMFVGFFCIKSSLSWTRTKNLAVYGSTPTDIRFASIA